MNKRQNAKSESRRRLSKLTQQSEETSEGFKLSNFYENEKINIEKLKRKIYEGKRKMRRFHSMSNAQKNELPITSQKGQRQLTPLSPKMIINKRAESKLKYRPKTEIDTELYDTQIGRKTFYQHIERKKSSSNKGGSLKIHPIGHRQCQTTKNHQAIYISRIQTETNTLVSQEPKKLLVDEIEVEQFELRIQILWELYERVIDLMRMVDEVGFNENKVNAYVREIVSEKYDFIEELMEVLSFRAMKVIRGSRLMEYLSVLLCCLESWMHRCGKAEIINLLGFSASSLVFIVRIFTLTHSTQKPLSPYPTRILSLVADYLQGTYKKQMSVQESLREIEHHNEIFMMLKVRHIQKYPKSIREFINTNIKSAERGTLHITKNAYHVFQFFAQYLHYERFVLRFALLCTPPTPFCRNLPHSLTIVIEPWQVLVYQKAAKWLVRSNTTTFLQALSKNFNLIFWTELMPREAYPLVEMFSSFEHIQWLFRYHCLYKDEHLIKVPEMAGCLPENTIMIDNKPQSLSANKDGGIVMRWIGEKRDIRLLALNDIIQQILKSLNTSEHKTLRQELKLHQFFLKKLNRKPLRKFPK